MSNMREVSENEVMAFMGDLRHMDLEEYDFTSINRILDKSANFLELLLAHRRDLMMRIAFLEGAVHGMGHQLDELMDIHVDYGDGMDEEDEDELEDMQ